MGFSFGAPPGLALSDRLRPRITPCRAAIATHIRHEYVCTCRPIFLGRVPACAFVCMHDMHELTVHDCRRRRPLPQSVRVHVATEHGTNVAYEPECVKHRQQVEEGRVCWVREPRRNRQRVVCKVNIRHLPRDAP